MEYKDPGRYIPIIYLLYSWGSQFGVPSRVPFNTEFRRRAQPLPHMALRDARDGDWDTPECSSKLPDPSQPELAQEFTAATGLPSRET